MCSLLSSELSKNRFPQKYDSGKYIPRFGGEDGRGDLEHANGNIQQLLEGTRPQTTGDVPRISVTQAVQNSLRKYETDFITISKMRAIYIGIFK